MSSKSRKIASVQGGVAIVNHCAVVNLLRIVNLLRCSIFSTAGSFGLWPDLASSDPTFSQLEPGSCRGLHVSSVRHLGSPCGNLAPVKSKRGREEGDGKENVINCRKMSQIVMTFYDEFCDDL